MGENNRCIPPNPRRVGYIVPIHGPLDEPLYMGSIYSNTPPQSELPVQRCSRLDNKKANTPNYRRSGVQNWTKREYKESTNGKYPPQPQLATCYVEAGAKLRECREG